jgi:hypothetical protein
MRKTQIQGVTLMSAAAAAINYDVLPPRLTPGLELTLPKCSIAVGRAALVLGLTLGGLIARGSAAVRHSLALGW